MKHAKLRAVLHNIADSLGGGCSLLMGSYGFDVYGDAAAAPSGRLTIDLLTGTADAPISPEVKVALIHLPSALNDQLARSGATISDLKQARVRYWTEGGSARFTICLEDSSGRASETDYIGSPGARLREMDPLGRLRRRPIRRA